MAIKKGYCTNCNKDNEIRRIFDVSTDAKFCYCPHCGKKYRPRIAISNYERTINLYLHRAHFILRNAGRPLQAYNLYAYILELEKSNKHAKMGRILSLAYSSTTRRNRFIEAKEMIEIEQENLSSIYFVDDYCEFLMKLEDCTTSYLSHVKKNLTLKSYFYDTDCIALYIKHIRDAIELRRLISFQLSYIGKQKESNIVNDEIKELEKEFKDTYFTVDGVDHYLANFSKNGEPLITSGVLKNDTKLSRYRMSSLDTNQKKLNIIKENVFPKIYSNMYKTFKISLTFTIILGIIALIALVFYLIFLKKSFSIAFLIALISFGVLSLSFLLMRTIIQVVLKKPRI